MNTPAHAIVNLLILGRKSHPETAAPIAIGSLLPDVLMVLFYVYHKALRATPEEIIWGDLYFDEAWQAFFDVFNSIPLILLGLGLAWRLRAMRWSAFFAAWACTRSSICPCTTTMRIDICSRYPIGASSARFLIGIPRTMAMLSARAKY